MARPLLDNLYSLKCKTKDGSNWQKITQEDFYRDKIANRDVTPTEPSILDDFAQRCKFIDLGGTTAPKASKLNKI